MMCDECGIRPAVVHLTTIVGGEVQKKNLCSACMTKIQKQMPATVDLDGLAGLLSGFFQSAQSGGSKEEEKNQTTLKCPHCGLSYTAFQKTGLLGCAQCYQAFREPLEVILKRIHGSTQHTGRVPRKEYNSISVHIQIDQLKRQLAQAVAAEEYENAAALRDQIRALQKQAEGDRAPDAPREESSHERA